MCGHRSAKLLGGIEANFWRVLVAVTMLGVYAFTLGGGISGRAFPAFLLSGLIGVGVGDLAFYYALPRLGPRLCSLLTQCLGAPVGALIEWLWLGTTLTTGQILLGLVALAGVALALAPNREEPHNRRGLVFGICLALIAGAGTAVGAVLSRKAYVVAEAAGVHVDGGTAAFQRVLGGLLVAVVALLLLKRREVLDAARNQGTGLLDSTIRPWRKAGGWILANSMAGQTLGVTCMQWALETTPAGVVLAIVAITPIVVIPFAVIFEGERPRPISILGGVIAVGGAIGLILVKH
jgi:drug/metabolite transporter (DMT)-like permease